MFCSYRDEEWTITFFCWYIVYIVYISWYDVDEMFLLCCCGFIVFWTYNFMYTLIQNGVKIKINIWDYVLFGWEVEMIFFFIWGLVFRALLSFIIFFSVPYLYCGLLFGLSIGQHPLIILIDFCLFYLAFITIIWIRHVQIKDYWSLENRWLNIMGCW